MSHVTKIEYADSSWNPVTGCSLVSEGCENCYIFSRIPWQKSRGSIFYKNESLATYHCSRLYEPMKMHVAKRIYICSMGDLFHERVPVQFIKAVFKVVEACQQHTFIVSTKRSGRLVDLADKVDWPGNLWVGVSIESADYLSRMCDLAFVPTEKRFVAFDPLIGKINHVDFTGIGWVIVGGESGPGARKMDLGTVRLIRDTAVASNTPFFFKQWDKWNKPKLGRTVDGVIWDQIP